MLFHQNAGNAPLVHFLDSKRNIPQTHLISDARHFLQLGKQPSPDGVIIFVFDMDVKIIVDFFNQQPGINQDALFFFLEKGPFIIKLILNLAENLLDDIFRGNQSGRTPPNSSITIAIPVFFFCNWRSTSLISMVSGQRQPDVPKPLNPTFSFHKLLINIPDMNQPVDIVLVILAQRKTGVMKPA